MKREQEPDLKGSHPFDEGLALFNAGRFFECHEHWEIVWKQASGAERQFYQGLIQAAAALLHAERGNPRGAASTHAKCLEKLQALPDVFMGIGLAELRADLAVFFACLADTGQLPARPRIKRSYAPQTH
jgi:uncharacterized protein